MTRVTRRGPKPSAPDGATRGRRLSVPLTDGELAAVKTAAAADATPTAAWARDVLLVAAEKREPTDG